MTRRRRIVIAVAAGVLLTATGAVGVYRGIVVPRRDRAVVAQLEADIAALEHEREVLLARRTAATIVDRRLENLPASPIKVGVPTALAASLIQKMVAGLADQVTIELGNLGVTKTGTIRKMVTLGTYDLTIRVNRITGRLKPGSPAVAFGGDAVTVALPVSIASGRGDATVRFRWDGRNVAGVVCGDMDVTRQVAGTVVPTTYTLSGRLLIRATATQLQLIPRVKPVKMHIDIKPTATSWAAARQILDDKSGVCGFVLDRVDIMGAVQKVVDRGFDVTLPLNRIKPVSLPVGVEPSIDVRGKKIALKVRLGALSLTERMLWLGVDVGFDALPKIAAR